MNEVLTQMCDCRFSALITHWTAKDGFYVDSNSSTDSSIVLSHRYSRFAQCVKGQEWYQADDIAEEYDDKRFSRAVS